MSQLAFQYRAIDRQGDAARGVLRADSREDAYRQIAASGLRPIRISKVGGRGGRRRKITHKDVAHFTYQFAVLMEAHIPVVDGLRSIGEQEQNATLKDIINDVAAGIESGKSVTESLGPHRAIFGEVYIESVRAAETSGNMIEVLANLASMLDRQYEMRKNIKGALMYPITVICALSVAVLFLMIFVVPRFAEMFASRGLDLPLPTQVVVGISDAIGSWWYIMLAGIVVGVWSLKRATRQEHVRRRIDTALHRVPLVREVLKGLAVSRFAPRVRHRGAQRTGTDRRHRPRRSCVGPSPAAGRCPQDERPGPHRRPVEGRALRLPVPARIHAADAQRGRGIRRNVAHVRHRRAALRP
jgi:type IV pilus assembly protein PilC